MKPGFYVFLALLYVIGLVLASNLRLTATTAGNYLFNKRRFGFVRWKHRREVLARLLGCAACFTGASNVTAVLPSAVALLALLAAMAVPAALWYATRDAHGADVPDNVGHKKLL